MASAVGERKKKSKGTQARGPGAMPKSRGTGFEEYYCDPPLTPAEYQEEHDDIYAPKRPIHVRIEACVQRYMSRRRIDSTRLNLFNNYLKLGGIDSSPRQFQGTRALEKEDIEDVDNDHLRAMQANEVIFSGGGSDERFYNPSNPEHWKVDFTGVTSGYLCGWLAQAAGGNFSLLEMGIDVASNFLKYVVAHGVCPEYSDDIASAIQVCEKARTELFICSELFQMVPGDFNSATRSLFCKSDKEDIYCFDSFDDSDYNEYHTSVVFNMNLLLWLDKESQKRLAASRPLRVDRTAQQIFEIVEIPQTKTDYPGKPRLNGCVIPDEAQMEKYNGIKIKPKTGPDGTEKVPVLKPGGVVRLKPTSVEDGWDGDQQRVDWIGDSEDFFFEMEIIKCLEPGMKLKLVVCELNCGVKFIKEVRGIYPTFYVFLPQELILKFKAPILSERPGPSVDNPEVEEDEDRLGD